ncbi:MAG: flippase-like domain-containing protein, partial [Phycisphaerae bacterium]|nr:flippase-like domain-containing protein [Phycisphaerae bacterium]
MTPHRRRPILVAIKVLIATGLLAWVLSGVHWQDYVVATNGRSYAVLTERPATADRPGELEVTKGLLWWRRSRTASAGEFQPIPGTSRVRRPGFATTVANVKLPLLTAAFAVYLANMVVISMRWWVLLGVVDIHISPWEAVRLSFLGAYFSTVVPGTVSGDFVKAYYAGKHTPAKAAALVSVFMDRAMGLAELTVIASVMLTVVYWAQWAPPETLRLPAILLAVLVAMLVAAFAFLFSPALRHRLRLQRVYNRFPLAGHLAAAGRAIRQYRGNVRRLIEALGITLIGQTLWIGSMVLVGGSRSVAVSWTSYFLYVPLIFTIAAVPLTPGGLGLVEKFFVVFFATGTVSASEVVALALL